MKNISDVMGSTMIDYEMASVAETQIMDVFEHESNPENHKKSETVATQKEEA